MASYYAQYVVAQPQPNKEPSGTVLEKEKCSESLGLRLSQPEVDRLGAGPGLTLTPRLP